MQVLCNYTVTILYFALIFLLFIGSIRGLYFIYLYTKLYKKKRKRFKTWPAELSLPKVTVQLPVFNEKYVVERLIESACNLDYPKDRLEIQVLDDSTDSTRVLAEQAVKKYHSLGFNIAYIHRRDRIGFKAGALAFGMRQAQGEFFLIFDADFLPPADLLKKMIPEFLDSRVGMVQSRWAHLNRNYSILTRIQSMLLDGHFMVEHTVRYLSGRFFNFNGTAGIWRRQTIEDAGGWQSDTLTEDIDLSYRAQLKGWKFVFLPRVICPAELPVEMNAFKSQQHRWGRGAIQTGKKLFAKIWKSTLPLTTKIEALYHLFGNLAFIVMLLLALLILPSLLARTELGWNKSYLIELPLILVTFFMVVFFYAFSQKEADAKAGGGWLDKFTYAPALAAISMGMSLNNAVAIFGAFGNKLSTFKRTAKYDIRERRGDWVKKEYRKKFNWSFIPELLFVPYLLFTLMFAVHLQMWGAIPLILLFLAGYLYVGSVSLIQSLR